ncbi:MAG: HDOD domain-containing protein, partial [Actinomycetota bacterium]|nr:HDOD domain-containing protein [Actinomycetota bacterium]
MTTTPADAASRGDRPNEGHGRRLTAAFDALEAFPALAESRDRVLSLVREERSSSARVISAIESDVALVTTVLRLANGLDSKQKGKIGGIPEAVALITPEGVEHLASRAKVFDFFERTPGWDAAPERFRLHAVATQAAADRLARELDYPDRDELVTSALLHDIGKLVLLHAYPAYPGQVHGEARTPEARIHRERRELGVDHALVGGVLARRWGLPGALATAIERHHSDDAEGQAAMVRLADMLAHYGHGQEVDPNALLAAARAVKMTPTGLRELMYNLPYAANGKR